MLFNILYSNHMPRSMETIREQSHSGIAGDQPSGMGLWSDWHYPLFVVHRQWNNIETSGGVLGYEHIEFTGAIPILLIIPTNNLNHQFQKSGPIWTISKCNRFESDWYAVCGETGMIIIIINLKYNGSENNWIWQMVCVQQMKRRTEPPATIAFEPIISEMGVCLSTTTLYALQDPHLQRSSQKRPTDVVSEIKIRGNPKYVEYFPKECRSNKKCEYFVVPYMNNPSHMRAVSIFFEPLLLLLI